MRSLLTVVSLSLGVGMQLVGCVLTTHEGPSQGPVVPPVPTPVDNEAEGTASPSRPKPSQPIRASHILISYDGAMRSASTVTRSREEAYARAREALLKARAGEDFAALAEQYSDDPGSAAQGGDLGEFTHDMMVPEFADAAFALKPGGLSKIVESPFGFHIILRTE